MPTDTHHMLLTMVVAISAGVMLIVAARRLNVPGIVLLLVGGALLGPGVMGEHALVDVESLGGGLSVIVSLAVGLILFEGGLTLDVTGYRSAPAMIWRLLTIGVLVTWITTAILIKVIVGLEVRYAVLAASLVIVTGPTVIAPLLKRVKVLAKLHSVLHWEGVLVDPIGVFIAILCYEFVISGATGGAALANLGVRIAAGMGFGIAGGAAIILLIRKKFVPEEMINVFALAAAVLIFGLAEWVRPEAGLLAAPVAGFLVGLYGPVKVKQIRQFKAEITDLLIGTLFILLASRLNMEQFEAFGWRGAIVVALVMVLVRPLSITLCSLGLDLTKRERTFLSWVAPRGIVAASMASLFSISMSEGDGAFAREAAFVETFTYSVIIATIMLQGLTAKPVARLCGVLRPEPTGWLIVGAHAFGRGIARFAAQTGKMPVVLVDTNARAVREAFRDRLPALVIDARDTSLQDRPEMQGVGNLLAMTDNEDLNIRLCQAWAEVFGPEHVYRCNPSGTEPIEENSDDPAPGRVVWPRVPRPTLVAGEVQRRETVIVETPAPRPALERLATPLAQVVDGRLVLGGLEETVDEKERDREKEPDESVDRPSLYLRRRADHLVRCLRPELIATVEATDLKAVLDQLMDRVISVHPRVPRDDTVRQILDQEAGFPSAIGHSVAVPHTYLGDLEARVCAIARIPAGIEMSAPDGELVHLVFLLLSPQGDPEGHLATLSEIARTVIDPEARQRLLDAPTPLDAIRIVRRVSRQ